MTAYYSPNRTSGAFVGVGGHPVETFASTDEEWFRIPWSVRKAVMHEMQRGRCYMCRARLNRIEQTFDHVRPKARGGLNEWNFLLACRPCNQRKADRPPHPCELLLLASVNWELRWRMAG